MDKRAFSSHGARVLASSRLMLGAVFLVAVILDPGHRPSALSSGLALLGAYVAFCAAMTVVAYRSWWFDFRLAPAVHIIDIMVFCCAAYLTETNHGEFNSPFIAFCAFLLINAMLRWGWRGVAWTALALVAMNALVGVTMYALHIDLDLYRFARRQVYMVMLSVIMIWLSASLGTERAVRLPEPPGAPGERRAALLASALAHARHILRAGSAALAISTEEEPWVELLIDEGGDLRAERIGPGPVTTEIDNTAAPELFDRPRHRRIAMREDGSFVAVRQRRNHALARLCGVGEGLTVSFSAERGRGVLVLWGIAGMGTDDLPVAFQLARELGVALDREEMASMARNTAVSAIRNAIARDLHDSVAQFLAGTLFRLEALRRWVKEGNDPDPEILAMKEALRREQTQLRVMIERLRRGEEGDRRTDLVEELTTLLDEVGHHWHISAKLDAPPGPMQVSIELAYEVRQLVREAVANAVRHGRCRNVDIRLVRDAAVLKMTICDDGIGFPADNTLDRPRSISERIDALGGQLKLAAGTVDRPGVTLDIELPVRLAA